MEGVVTMKVIFYFILRFQIQLRHIKIYRYQYQVSLPNQRFFYLYTCLSYVCRSFCIRIYMYVVVFAAAIVALGVAALFVSVLS